MLKAIISIWSFKADEASVDVWPDGCRDFVAMLSPGRTPEVLCTGLDFSVRRVVCPAGSWFAGIRFAPGVSFPWDEETPECRVRDVDIARYDDAFGQELMRRNEQPEKVQELLHDAAERWLRPAPVWVSGWLGDRCSDREESGRDRGFSERSVRRHFIRDTGAPQRYWRNLARARQAARAVVSNGEPLAGIAMDLGFSDQAHMCRELKRWFDCTPVAMRNNRGRLFSMLSAPDAFYAKGHGSPI